jgi:hypothetical protein
LGLETGSTWVTHEKLFQKKKNCQKQLNKGIVLVTLTLKSYREGKKQKILSWCGLAPTPMLPARALMSTISKEWKMLTNSQTPRKARVTTFLFH